MKLVPIGALSGHFLPLLWLLTLLAGHSRGDTVTAVSLADPAITEVRWGNGDSFVADVSGDGRYVVMVSSASNLTLDEPSQGVLDVYLRDRTHGTVVLVSRSREGNRGGNDHSTGARITPDGGHIVYQSRATDLVEDDMNGADDIFLWDAASGTTRLVSVTAGGDHQSGNGGSSAPVLTPDGRHIAFVSAASDLVLADTNGIPDIFVRDMQDGVTRLASAGATRVDHVLTGSASPVITRDGRYVVFESLAGDLVPGVQLTVGQVYLRDMVEERTVWVSQHATNLLGVAAARCYNAVVSEDGRFVAFKSGPLGPGWPPPTTLFRHDVLANLTEWIAHDGVGNDISIEDDSGPAMTPDGRIIAFTRRPLESVSSDVYIWDSATGEIELVSVNRQGTGGGDVSSDTPRISADGRHVTFLSSATNLVDLPVDGASLWYLRDRELEVTTLLSANPDGTVSGGQDVVTPVISADASFAAFDVIDDRLLDGDRNRVADVFGREIGDPDLSLLSAAIAGWKSVTGSGRSWSARRSMSADGRFVVFVSEAEDLVPNDSNGSSDVFMRDLESGNTILISVNATGTMSGNQASADPSISRDGRKVAFASYANDLVANDGNDREDVFVRDWVAGATVLASVGTSGQGTTPRVRTQPVLSPDGRYVVFKSRSTELVEEPLLYTVNLYARDLETGTTQLITKDLPGTALSIPLFSEAVFPAHATVVLFDASTTQYRFIYRVDLIAGTRERIDVLRPGVLFERWFAHSFDASSSADGRRVAFVSSNSDLVEGDVNLKQDVFMRDLNIGETQLVSMTADGVGGNGDALEAVISDDGYWVAFTSCAGDLASDDANRGDVPGTGDRDVFLHRLGTGLTRLISRSCRHGGSANGPSDSPAISADGRYVTYRSMASDLVPNDFNSSPDVFVYDRQTDLTTLITVSAMGPVAADERSHQPALSADGRVLLFNSWASDLIDGDYNETSDVFWAWTDQTGRLSSLIADIEAIHDHGVRIFWSASPGQHYGVRYIDALTASEWIDLPGPVLIEGGRGMMEDLEPAATGHRYYRVILKE